MAYHIDYRPKNFSEFIGNSGTIRSISRILKEDPQANHSWLLSGPSGVGKTSLARIIAKKIGATPIAIIEHDSANARKIDNARDLVNGLQFKIPGSKVVVHILDEAHQIIGDAQEVLLKPIEEPPAHVYFILCTTEPKKIKNTIITRCLPYTLRLLNADQIAKLLYKVLDKEKLSIPESVIDLIIDHAGGSGRLALNMLATVAPCVDDMDQVEECLTSILNERPEDGDYERSNMVVSLLLKKNIEWSELTDYVYNQYGYKNIGNSEMTSEIKRGTMSVLAWQLKKHPSAWRARAIKLLEHSLKGANTKAGFIADLYEIWRLVRDGPETNRSSNRGLK